MPPRSNECVLTLHITSADSLLFESDIVAIGSFRCPPVDPLFPDSGPIGNPLFAFPRTAVTICYEDGTTFVSDPNTIPLYNRGQVFSRRSLGHDRGDVADWYAVADDVLLDAIAAYDGSIYDRPDHPFPAAYVPANTWMYLEQRRLVDMLYMSATPDPLAVEETILGLLDSVLRQVYGSAAGRGASRRLMRERVEAARFAIARDLTRNVSLSELAEQAECSPFALCRAFHTLMGMTTTEYRQSLRLRSALELLRGDTDLLTVALDLGFSSHSHFTKMFRRMFGMTPTEFRLWKPDSRLNAGQTPYWAPLS
jgi:AraC-like DNA-binding protein